MSDWKIRKLCNAFIANAIPSALVQGPALSVVDRMSRKTGGLWVGGSVTANPRGLLFAANAMNQAFHVGLEDVFIAAADIRSITRVFGWLTGIVVVQHAEGEFRFRCFGAKQFAASLAARFETPARA